MFVCVMESCDEWIMWQLIRFSWTWIVRPVLLAIVGRVGLAILAYFGFDPFPLLLELLTSTPSPEAETIELARWLVAGLCSVLILVAVPLFRRLANKSNLATADISGGLISHPVKKMALPRVEHEDSYPNIRMADCEDIKEIWNGPDRSKLIALLEAEKLWSWAKPIYPPKADSSRLKGIIWSTHKLDIMPKGDADNAISQTFLRASGASTYYDVYLNRLQLKGVWPDKHFLPRPDRTLAHAMSYLVTNVWPALENKSYGGRIEEGRRIAAQIWRAAIENKITLWGVTEEDQNYKPVPTEYLVSRPFVSSIHILSMRPELTLNRMLGDTKPDEEFMNIMVNSSELEKNFTVKR